MGCNRLATGEDKEAVQLAIKEHISFKEAKARIRAEHAEFYAKLAESMFPNPSNLDAKGFGRAVHADVRAAEASSGPLGGGWLAYSNESTVGGTKRPDQVYINPEQKRILVQDTYTGSKSDVTTASGPESMCHYQKGWAYSSEPALAALIRQGYRFDYAVLSSKLVH